MPYQRWEPFSNGELHEIRCGLKKEAWTNALAARIDCIAMCDKLMDEIGHVQEQREMARRREELPS